MDEKTAETLIISWISASVKEVPEAMKGIMTPFQKTMMKQVLTYLRELSERMEAMDIIIETYRATYWEAIKKLEQIANTVLKEGISFKTRYRWLYDRTIL